MTSEGFTLRIIFTNTNEMEKRGKVKCCFVLKSNATYKIMDWVKITEDL